MIMNLYELWNGKLIKYITSISKRGKCQTIHSYHKHKQNCEFRKKLDQL